MRMRKLRDILRLEIPSAAILRFWLVFLGLLSLGLTSLMTYIMFLPRGSGQTPGDYIMSKGGCIAMLLPIVMLSTVPSVVITFLNRSRLPLVWLAIGYSPPAILGLAIVAAIVAASILP